MAIPLVFHSFYLALGQLADPRFRRVFFLGIAMSLVLLIAFTAGFAMFIDWFTGEENWLPLLGEVSWLDDLFSWGAALLLAILSIFLMVPVASAITSLFLDDVAEAVEGTHYPALPAAQGTSIGDSIRDTINFLGVLVVANLFALILYIFFAPFAPLIFWALNGFLLGREYYTMAAMRRVGRVRARQLRRRNMGTIWAAGVLMAVPLSVPLLNLLVPILGAATFTHLYHALPHPKD